MSLFRLRELVVIEWLLRFRRASTGVLFLVLCAAAYLTMPDVTEGKSVFQIGGARVYLNSAATAFATALLGTLLLGLFGFYLAGNAVTRDARTGVGRLIAATPVSSAGYLAGKFLGNVMYLTAVTAAFMAACMGMHLIRGEGPLEPLVFVVTYGIFFLPLLPFLAALALLFESIPLLSGRGGDVAYFFLWLCLLVVPTIPLSAGAEPSWWVLSADITGLGFAVAEMARVAHTSHFSIGVSDFDAALAPVLFPGLRWDWSLAGPRVLSTLLVLPLLAAALAAFRRFDPARARKQRSASGFFAAARLDRLAAFGRRLFRPRGGWAFGPPSLRQAVALDVRLSIALSPLIAPAVLFFAAAGMLAPLEGLRTGFVPAMFVVLVPLLAALATRDQTVNMTGLLFSAPLIRKNFVLLKLLSAFVLTILVGLIPLVRLGLAEPVSGLGLLVGLLFIAAAAVSLGVMTGSPRAFAVLFLLFLYLVANSRTVAGFDFAGWNGVATHAVRSSYVLVAAVLTGAAWLWQRARLRREA